MSDTEGRASIKCDLSLITTILFMPDTQGKANIEYDLSFYYKVSGTEGRASIECDELNYYKN